jgi:hypothetical protein
LSAEPALSAVAAPLRIFVAFCFLPAVLCPCVARRGFRGLALSRMFRDAMLNL